MKSRLTDTKEKQQTAIVVFVNEGKKEIIRETLDELTGLVTADEINVVGELVQNIHEKSAATLIGKGKLEQLAEMVKELDATYAVFDNELSGSQIKNIEDIINARVLTRSMVILDIFAKRATSNEGKKQTELAQLKYLKSRITGSFIGNGRFGKGGVGSRGPGETQLELDKRKMEDKILKLQKEIQQIGKQRDVRVKKQKQSGIKKVAIVGYTNAGKSTLLNYITKADVLEKDMLFATLDTTTRYVYLTDKQQILITDTVGFVSKLPHEFVSAFKGTLSEACDADVLIIVCDSSSKHLSMQLDVAKQVLKDLKATGKTIVCLNKMDKDNLNTEQINQIKESEEIVIEVAARTGKGVDKLKQTIANLLC